MRAGTAPAAVAALILATALVAAPVAAQTAPDLSAEERQAVSAVLYLISIVAVGGVWWAYRHHMKAPPEAAPALEGFCPNCGAPAQGRYCARCGHEREGSA